MIREKRQTKIIWSLDGSKLSAQLADRLAEYPAVSAVRLIYEPQHLESILEFIQRLQSHHRSPQGYPPVMIDVGSQPRALVAKLSLAGECVFGQKLRLSPAGKGGDIELSSTEDWDSLFNAEASVFFGYGNVILKVEQQEKDLILCEVIKGGEVGVGHEIHVPATRKVPSIFDLSVLDIKPLQGLGIDYVVLPGMASAREIALVRKKLSAAEGVCPWLIVRIDSREAYENLHALLEEADGVLISRRELALTMHAASVPMLSKEIIRECNEKAKLVFIASEMLASLRHNPTPTRAEVSDLANAVIDGTDAIVLSEDITNGKYYEKALSLSASIINDVEEHTDVEVNWKKEALAIRNEFDAVAYHAYRTAERVKAKAIVCITKAGNTALRLASFRSTLPIIAVTFTEAVKRRLALVRGVYALVLDVAPHLDEVLPVVNERLKQESWLASGDRIVFVTVTLSPVGQEASNLFTVQRLD